MNLFDRSGGVVHKIEMDVLPMPGLIIWKGRYFILEVGRYVETTVHFA